MQFDTFAYENRTVASASRPMIPSASTLKTRGASLRMMEDARTGRSLATLKMTRTKIRLGKT